jgi:hypothetical protein
MWRRSIAGNFPYERNRVSWSSLPRRAEYKTRFICVKLSFSIQTLSPRTILNCLLVIIRKSATQNIFWTTQENKLRLISIREKSAFN